MIHPRNKDTNRYPLFNELISEYTLDNTLLDYGGSSGNLIYFSDGAINKSKYTCVDVVKDAIDTGQLEFPDSNFIHWNRYNEMYNTNGIKKEPLPILGNHDYIWGYSVFSHMILEDIIEVILWMKSLNPKKIVMSYLNNDHDDNSNRVMNYFYQKRIKEFNSCVDFRLNKNSFFYLSDNEYGNKDSKLFISVYNTKWLSEQLEKYNIKIKKIHASNFSIPFLEIS